MSEPATQTNLSKAALTQEKLLSAGIHLFSQQGFEATSTRQVQQLAGVQRNLITYHFGSKEAFWKACMGQLFGRISNSMQPAIAQSVDIEPVERIRFLIRRFIRASAAHPESTRIMFDEGRSGNWRLEWLIAHYAKPFFDLVCDLYADGGYKDTRGEGTLTEIQLYYLVVGSAAGYAMGAEYQQLSGSDPFDEKLIDQHANAMAEIITQNLTRGSERK